MSSEILKSRAKRLRPVIAEMFSVSVTNSQSLELVAKEENFPSWDAACASFQCPAAKQTTDRVMQQFDLSIQSAVPVNLASIMGGHKDLQGELKRLLTKLGSGALVLVAGLTFSGRTSTVRVIVDELLTAEEGKAAIPVAHFGQPEQPYQANVRYIDNNETCLGVDTLPEGIVIMDEVRTGRLLFEAVALALAGKKVIATVHAKPPVSLRLEALLRNFGVGQTILNELVEKGQCLAIHQELIWTDATHQAQSTTEKQGFMLRHFGVEESRIAALVSEGDTSAIFHAINPELFPTQK